MPTFTGQIGTTLSQPGRIQLAHIPAVDDDRAWTYDGDGTTHTYNAADDFTYGNTADWTYTPVTG